MAYGTDHRGIAIAVVAAAALAVGVFVGFLLDKEESDDGASPSPATTEVDGSGPTDEINGVPIGYARTEDGAVAAAANFQLLSAKDSLLDREALVTAMQTFAAPAWKQEAARQARNGYEYIADTYGADADVSAAVLRYSVDDFNPDRAVVRLWTVSLVSGPKRPSVEEVWAIVTVDLAWINDDWRVRGIESSVGPAPVDLPSGQPSQTAGNVMEEFNEFEGAQTP